ncbi:MAG: hypothetical protein GY930_11730 [bacterium]|nr:hypothetical protein [bacterium]
MGQPRLEVTVLTPAGPAGVAVIELHGPDLTRVLGRVGVSCPTPGELRLAHLCVGEERLDEALICGRTADRVELHVHGSVPLVQEIMEILGAGLAALDGAQLALEEACWQAMSSAPSEVGARIALGQSEGLLRSELQRLMELSDGGLGSGLADLCEKGTRAKRWLHPTRVALQGPPNAGKSTLFNALVGHTRVVTSEEAGTTRDPILEATCLAGWPVELVDTAGLRPVGAGSLEGRGQDLGQRLADQAEVVFHLVPFGDAVEVPERTHKLITHGDRAGAPDSVIDALHDPLGASQHVGRLLGEILDTGPAWDFSWAVPCTMGQRDLVQRAASMEDPAGARSLIAAALASPSG